MIVGQIFLFNLTRWEPIQLANIGPILYLCTTQANILSFDGRGNMEHVQFAQSFCKSQYQEWNSWFMSRVWWSTGP